MRIQSRRTGQFQGGFENYCGENQDRIWQWTANPTDGVAHAVAARRGDAFFSYGSAPMPSAADTFIPLEGDGALKLFADGESTTGASGLTLTRTTPSLAGRHVLIDAFVYISRFEPLEDGASGELTFTSFGAGNNAELEFAATSIYNDRAQDTWHSIRLCSLVPEGTGTTEIGINLTHTNSARGTIYVDNVRMREVSLCVYDEELDETDFGDLPQTSTKRLLPRFDLPRGLLRSQRQQAAQHPKASRTAAQIQIASPYNSAPNLYGNREWR